ncbi:hypothetical protein MHYP_G00127270 [Metynnis hypsauchen]
MLTEEEVGVSAAEQFVQHCQRAWWKARASLLITTKVTYWLCLLPSKQIHPTFPVSLLRPLLCGTRPLASRLVAGSLAYTVRRLLDSHCVWGGIQYLVDWEGYGPEEWSWVLACHILDPWTH